MRDELTAVLVTALVTVSAPAAEPPVQADDASALIALEHTWVEALQKNDVKTLSNILASTYVDTDETGHRGDRAAVLGALRSGALKLSLIELSDMKPVIYGHAAVVTGASVQRGTYEGQPLADRIVFTDTFIRTDSATIGGDPKNSRRPLSAASADARTSLDPAAAHARPESRPA